MDEGKTESMLGTYRVLDLTDEKGLFCGRLLADLGADVIKIEKHGGDLARNIGPFYHDEVNPERSLFWFAMNNGKRGITLDITNNNGQNIFKQLVETADFVIESFTPGYLDNLGLGYSCLEKVNPAIIMVSITPFGQTGPYKNYKVTDIVSWAMGGHMYVNGDTDRPPVRISHHSQAYLHAAADAAVAAMIALYDRANTGQGQHVDVSIHEAVTRISDSTISWETNHVVRKRGVVEALGRINTMWPCKDGHVVFSFWSGPRAKRFNTPLINMMYSEGLASPFIKNIDWDEFDLRAAPQEEIDQLEGPTRKFFMAHTKNELLERAVKYGVTLVPLATVADMLGSAQLDSRKFWVQVDHPELSTKITYPGAFVKASLTPLKITRRAPLVGEHNEEILKELKKEPAKTGAIQPKFNIYKGNEITRKPLQGIKVADFSSALIGPISTKPLSDFGAEVIKVESLSHPETMRVSRPFKDRIEGLNRAAYFNMMYTGKKSLGLNLIRPRAVEVAKKLVAWADIVIENFAGGVISRMGLGYEELKKVKPDIIMLSSCMMGQTGPQSSFPGYGRPLTALAGFTQIAGWPDRPPAELNVYTDFVVPHFNTLILLAALDYRQHTGKGQFLDLSQYESALHMMSPLILDYVVNKRIATRLGNHCYGAAPHGAYRCLGEDRWCAIAVYSEEEWNSFCNVIGDPVWTKETRFNTLFARKENENALDKLVDLWTRTRTAEEVMALMQAAGVPAGVLETGEDLLEKDPQLKDRHFFWEVEHPEIGKYRVEREPFLLSKSTYKMAPAPLLGQHNDYVMKEVLGISEEEITDLVIDGAIE